MKFRLIKVAATMSRLGSTELKFSQPLSVVSSKYKQDIYDFNILYELSVMYLWFKYLKFFQSPLPL